MDNALSAAEQALAIAESEKVFAARLRIMDTKQWEIDGTWLISYRTLTRLRVTATPGFCDYRSR